VSEPDDMSDPLAILKDLEVTLYAADFQEACTEFLAAGGEVEDELLSVDARLAAKVYLVAMSRGWQPSCSVEDAVMCKLEELGLVDLVPKGPVN